ncbi:MAG: FAD-dependent oxidoreductase, partial [Novosphingobium sp.]|uniref:FAD-dependent oxidoreductase n=1 Tax=Novosphingobium sp. TaxID=1874826 RepID=UPI0032B83DC9
RALVNAAGPAVLAVEGLLGAAPDYAMRLVRGSHIVVRKLFDHPYAYFFQLPDGRIFFAIPYERSFTLIGTTDVDHQPGQPIAASADEVAYLCEGASTYFRTKVNPADVVWTYSGVRPLIDDGSGRPEAATRGYRLELSDPAEGAPLLSVYGGKITTYRHLAEEAVDRLAPRVPALSGPAWTATRPLPGGDFGTDGLEALKGALARDHPDLDPATVDRIARAYGTRARRWLDAPRGRDFGGGLCQAEVDYLVAAEWAVSAEDILWRRTKLGLRLGAAQQAALTDYLGG